MELENGDKVSIRLIDANYMLRSIDRDSGEQNYIVLRPWQARLIAQFINHNMPLAVERDEITHDLNDRGQPDCEIVEALEVRG